MAWQITRGGTDHTVEVEDRGDGNFVVTIDGTEHPVHAVSPEAGVFAITRGAHRVEADVVRDGTAVAVTIDGQRQDLTVIDERQLALAALGLGGAAGGDQVVSTSMPGKVVALLVAEGDVVEAGQGVIVVEAMKMENELKAAAAGTVASIEVAVGAAVQGGAALVVIEPLAD